ncbi:hypothetical protein BJ508DRAFT_308075 [Ascobolus immersus RN42]|uniref:2OGFeDO JBP1/TET oxygenase domain-containing protein n=1 Tax=Ascobolus immersus RN42 TaxID=1160509 RepID=A0A3N4I2Z5_ASCIM|nr:hypothetical protein BJ508DRAFT_308075 [Ascobolus immersus RN42]
MSPLLDHQQSRHQHSHGSLSSKRSRLSATSHDSDLRPKHPTSKRMSSDSTTPAKRARLSNPHPSVAYSDRAGTSSTRLQSSTIPGSPLRVDAKAQAGAKIRFKLCLQLDAVLANHEKRMKADSEVVGDHEPDTSIHNAPDTKDTDEPPHNPRKEGFPAWLETRDRAQLLDFLADRRSLLERAASDPDILVSHAKSLCDHGDKIPAAALPTPPPPTQQSRNFGSSKRPKGPKQRRSKNRPDRSNHYGHKLEEKQKRIATVLNSREFALVRDHLDSLDLSTLEEEKGRQQPDAYESMQLVEEGKEYLRIPTHISEEGFCITDKDGKVLVDVLPTDSIPPSLVEQFEHSFKSLCDEIPDSHFKISKSDKRFIEPARAGEHGGVLHLGVWNQSTWQHERPAVSQSLRGDRTNYRRDPVHIRLSKFLNDNWELFRHLGGILKAHDPELYEEYENVELPSGIDRTLFWPFCMMALNRNYLSLPHKDLNDYVRGFCLLHCWGEFKGADLTFKELKIRIPLVKGQVVLFRSSILTHWNQPIHDQPGGIRHSMVLFTPWRMLEWRSITIRQVTNRIKREVKLATAMLETLST